MTKILQRRKFVDKECKLCERFLLYQIQCHNMVLFFVFHDTNQYIGTFVVVVIVHRYNYQPKEG
jgi:hypothetical protein